jgi:Glycosyl hydrolase catalytic core
VYGWAALRRVVHRRDSFGYKISLPPVRADVQLILSLCVSTRSFIQSTQTDFKPKSDWYDVNATAFQMYLENFHATFQLPLWITEWTCQNYNNVNAQCSPSDIVQFMNQTQSFMDQSTFVERYAWFGAMENLQGVNMVCLAIF